MLINLVGVGHSKVICSFLSYFLGEGGRGGVRELAHTATNPLVPTISH